MGAPTEGYFDVKRGRINAGQLELLLQFQDAKQKRHEFWWNLCNERDTEELANRILARGEIEIKGSVKKLIKHLHS